MAASEFLGEFRLMKSLLTALLVREVCRWTHDNLDIMPNVGPDL